VILTLKLAKQSYCVALHTSLLY